jgi:hypothetical protein
MHPQLQRATSGLAADLFGKLKAGRVQEHIAQALFF